jgi:hypothetical protein
MASPGLSKALQKSFYTACSCSGITPIDFGFDALIVRLVNLSGKPIYVNFGSSAASTGDAYLSTGESFSGQVPLTRILSFNTTSSGAEVSVFALG